MKKKENYIRGAAVITGKVWRGDYGGYYLNGIDLDNQKAIEDVCHSFKDGSSITPEKLADQTLVATCRRSNRDAYLHLFQTRV
jgi:hypothetical protein